MALEDLLTMPLQIARDLLSQPAQPQADPKTYADTLDQQTFQTKLPDFFQQTFAQLQQADAARQQSAASTQAMQTAIDASQQSAGPGDDLGQPGGFVEYDTSNQGGISAEQAAILDTQSKGAAGGVPASVTPPPATGTESSAGASEQHPGFFGKLIDKVGDFVEPVVKPATSAVNEVYDQLPAPVQQVIAGGAHGYQTIIDHTLSPVANKLSEWTNDVTQNTVDPVINKLLPEVLAQPVTDAIDTLGTFAPYVALEAITGGAATPVIVGGFGALGASDATKYWEAYKHGEITTGQFVAGTGMAIANVAALGKAGALFRRTRLEEPLQIANRLALEAGDRPAAAFITPGGDLLPMTKNPQGTWELVQAPETGTGGEAAQPVGPTTLPSREEATPTQLPVTPPAAATLETPRQAGVEGQSTVSRNTSPGEGTSIVAPPRVPVQPLERTPGTNPVHPEEAAGIPTEAEKDAQTVEVMRTHQLADTAPILNTNELSAKLKKWTTERDRLLRTQGDDAETAPLQHTIDVITSELQRRAAEGDAQAERIVREPLDSKPPRSHELNRPPNHLADVLRAKPTTESRVQQAAAANNPRALRYLEEQKAKAAEPTETVRLEHYAPARREKISPEYAGQGGHSRGEELTAGGPKVSHYYAAGAKPERMIEGFAHRHEVEVPAHRIIDLGGNHPNAASIMERAREIASKRGEGVAPTKGDIRMAIKQHGYLGLTSSADARRIYQLFEDQTPLTMAEGLVSHTKREGGATLDPRTNRHYDSSKGGYGVGVAPDRGIIVPEAKFEPQKLENWVVKNADLLRQKDHYIGTWKDDAGDVHIDISQVVRDRDSAVRLAQSHDQESIWDYKAGESIDTTTAATEAMQRKARERALGAIADSSDAATKGLYKDLPPIGGGAVPTHQDLVLYGAARKALFREGAREWAAAMVREFPDQGWSKQRWIDEVWGDARKEVRARTGQLKAKVLADQGRLMELFNSGVKTAAWYDKTAARLRPVFGDDTGMFIRFLASASGNTSPADSIRHALRAYEQWQAGEAFNGFPNLEMKRNFERAVMGVDIQGPKVEQYLRALMGDRNAIAVDRWVVRALGAENVGKFTRNVHAFAQQVIRLASKEAGVDPRAFQAGIWGGIRLEEAAKGNRFAMGDNSPLEKILFETMRREGYKVPQRIGSAREYLRDTLHDVLDKNGQATFLDDVEQAGKEFGRRVSLAKRMSEGLEPRTAEEEVASSRMRELFQDRLRTASDTTLTKLANDGTLPKWQTDELHTTITRRAYNEEQQFTRREERLPKDEVARLRTLGFNRIPMEPGELQTFARALARLDGISTQSDLNAWLGRNEKYVGARTSWTGERLPDPRPGNPGGQKFSSYWEQHSFHENRRVLNIPRIKQLIRNKFIEATRLDEYRDGVNRVHDGITGAKKIIGECGE